MTPFLSSSVKILLLLLLLILRSQKTTILRRILSGSCRRMQGLSEGDHKKGQFMNFDFHRHHQQMSSVPKGFLAVTVGQGAEQRRFVIPVMYVNHPLFTQLLKEAEEEYGFYQRGAINIPCHVEEFCAVRGIIDEETTPHPPGHHHHHHFLCFKA